MSRSRLAVLPISLVVALALGACGSSKKDTTAAATTTPPATTTAATTTDTTAAAPAGGAETVKLSADKSGALKFDTTTLKAKAGSVTVDLTNPSPLPHAIAVEGNGVDKDGQTVSTGGHSTVTLTLKPGKYTYYCPVPGHRAGGMQGTLTVS